MGNYPIIKDHPLRYLSYDYELNVLGAEYLQMTKTRVLRFFFFPSMFLLCIIFKNKS